MVQRIQDERNNPWGGEIESSFDLIIAQWKVVLKVSRNDNSRYSHLGVSFSSDRGQSQVGVGGRQQTGLISHDQPPSTAWLMVTFELDVRLRGW